ncbi:MAG: CvpA family protein [Wujia sp.]
MSIFEIVVICVFIIFSFMGYKRGFLRSVLKVLLTGLSLVLAYLLAPVVSALICHNTSLDDFIEEKVYEKVEDVVQECIKDGITDFAPNISEDNKDKLSELFMEIELTQGQQDEFINRLEVPDFVKKALKENNNKATREEMGVDSFYGYLAAYVARMIVNSLAFLITYILFALLMHILFVLSAIASHIPVINGLNRLGGLALGIIEALIIVWIMMILVAVFINSDFGNAVYKQIENSSFLGILYEKNIFMKLITKY